MAQKCPYCDFTALSRKVIEMHIAEKHKDKIEQKEKQKPKEKKKQKREEKKQIDSFTEVLRGAKVKLYLRGGKELEGEIIDTSKYEIRLMTGEKQLIVFKHTIDYLELLT